MSEIVVDSFAGGGGASTGIEMALGRSPDIAINHDATALAMHEVNHPATRHLTEDVWNVDPLAATGGRPVGLAWFSPDCKHFSKAKGGKPVDKNIRGLAWVVVHWANTVRPRVIILENVEEFQTWGPLGPDNQPCPARKGETFKRWTAELRRLGYVVEWQELRACDVAWTDYGMIRVAPTIRKRLYLIARRDGRAIVWPAATHAEPDAEAVQSGELMPHRTAAEIIDWSLPCPSIFATAKQIKAKYGVRAKRPLEPASLERLAKGVRRYVVDAAEPFIINLTHQGGARVESLSEPLKTTTAAHRGEKALVSPYISIAQQGGSNRPVTKPLHTATASDGDQNQVVAAHLTKFRANSVGAGLDEPAPTVTANSFVKRPGGAAPIGLVAATFMAQNNYSEPGHAMTEPVSTIVSKGSTQSFVAANILRQFGTAVGHSMDEPMRTVMSDGDGGKNILAAACLQKYYGADQDPDLREPLHTATAKARFSVAEALLEIPPFGPNHYARARKVAKLLRKYGLWDDREFVTFDVAGVTVVIVDLGMRMLTPRELFRAQGFPDSYIIDRKPDGSKISKTEQISKCGNSVCPPIAAALVKANYTPDEALPEFLEAAE